MCTTNRNVYSVFRLSSVFLCVCVAIVSSSGACLGASSSSEQFEAYHRSRLENYDGEFARLRNEYADVPAVQAYLARIDLVNTVGREIVGRCSTANAGTLDTVLESVLDDSDASLIGHEPSGQDAKRLDGAVEVYWQYKGSFTKIPTLPAMSGKDRELLDRYHADCISIPGEFISQQQKVLEAIGGPPYRQMVESYLLLHVLSVADELWTKEHISALPKWTQNKRTLSICEDAAIGMARPITALRFREQIIGKPMKTKAVCEYLSSKAVELERLLQHRATVEFLVSALNCATNAKDPDLIIECASGLAEIYGRIGHPQRAAVTMKSALAVSGDAGEWGKGTVQHLRFLYRAEMHREILERSAVYRDDARCAKYRPQIEFMRWLVLDTLGRAAEAKVAMQGFLTSYPKHPFGAEMYYRQAIAAINRGEPEEAERLCNIVKYRYPRHRRVYNADKILKSLSDSDDSDVIW